MITRKSFGTVTLLLAMLLVSSIVLVSAASAAADKANANNFSDNEVETYGIEGLTPEKVKEIEAEVNRVRNMPDTIHNAPYIGLVTANDETKKVILGYIDNLSVSNSEKKEMKKELKDIWSRVPDKITEKDYPMIQKIGDAVTKYVEETYWTGGQSIQWKSTAHSGLIKAGVNLVYKNSQWAGWAANYAPKPDSQDQGADRYWYHYYNPSVGGGAPAACSARAAVAKTYYSKGSSYRQSAFENLGLASHYLSDAGQPMHTGLSFDTFKKEQHLQYERYVDNNWASGCQFSQCVNSNTVINSVTDPSQAVKNLAAFSKPYYSQLWAEINNNPTNFDTITTRYITTKCLRETARYNAGLAKYIKS